MESRLARRLRRSHFHPRRGIDSHEQCRRVGHACSGLCRTWTFFRSCQTRTNSRSHGPNQQPGTTRHENPKAPPVIRAITARPANQLHLPLIQAAVTDSKWHGFGLDLLKKFANCKKRMLTFLSHSETSSRYARPLG